MNNYLVTAIEKKDKIAIKNALCGIIRNDPSFVTIEFDSACKYADKEMKGTLYEEHDSENFKTKDEWDNVYFSYQIASLMSNFSKERMTHIKAVGRQVYEEKYLDAQKKKTKIITTKMNSEDTNGGINTKKLPLIVIAAVLIVIYLLVQAIRLKKAAAIVGAGLVVIMKHLV